MSKWIKLSETENTSKVTLERQILWEYLLGVDWQQAESDGKVRGIRDIRLGGKLDDSRLIPVRYNEKPQ